MTDQSIATAVSEWKKTHHMSLPSGNVAELKRAALIDLIALGDIPDTLGPLAAEMASAQKDRQLKPDELKRYAEIVNVIVEAAMVSPKVTKSGGNDSIAITDVEWIDKVQIYSWCNGATTTLRPFRNNTGGKTRTFQAS